MSHTTRPLVAAFAVAALTLPAARAVPPAVQVGTGTACAPAGAGELLRPGAVLLFGEMHGSAEIPAFVGDVACAVRAADLPVLVALEVPVEELPRIEAFLATAGAPADRAALLAGPFWSEAFQDGRRSAAMLELLDRLRGLRQVLGGVTVTAFDGVRKEASGQARDEAMAARLVAAIQATAKETVALVLAGNVHTRTRPGVPWDASYRPMAYLAVPQLEGRKVLAFDLASPPGAVWMCPSADAASCGPQQVGGRGDGRPRLELLPAPEGGHDGRFHVTSLTPSPPATAAAKSSPAPAEGQEPTSEQTAGHN
jgi:hypothetical protein